MIDKLENTRLLREVRIKDKNIYINLSLNTASSEGEFGDIYYVDVDKQTITHIGDDHVIKLRGLRRNYKNRVLINYNIEGVYYDKMITIKKLLYNNLNFAEKIAFKYAILKYDIKELFK